MVTVLITPPEAPPPVGAFLRAVVVLLVVFSCVCAVDTFLPAVVWDLPPPPPPCPPPAPACPPPPPACPPQLASQRARKRTRAATQGVRSFNILSLLSSFARGLFDVGTGCHRMRSHAPREALLTRVPRSRILRTSP